MNALIRPAWTPATIALMIIGFMVFWPLGVAMIAYIVWGDRLDQFKADVNRATDKASSVFSSGTFRGPFAAAGLDRTGNVAFDDWREGELKRLHEERMKLDTMRAEFDDYARELRRAKDQGEFESFMSSRTETVENETAPKKVIKPAKAKKAGNGKPATA